MLLGSILYPSIKREVIMIQLFINESDSLWGFDFSKNKEIKTGYNLYIYCLRIYIYTYVYVIINSINDFLKTCCVCIVLCTRVKLHQSYLTLCDSMDQAPLSTGFSVQEHWSGLPGPPPGGLSKSEIEPLSLQADSLPLSHQRCPYYFITCLNW